MIIDSKIKDDFRLDNAQEMQALNNTLTQNNAPVSWSYCAETRVLTLDLPDDFDSDCLMQYGEIIDTDN